jgi:dolichol-phosphate mannosyltransferase
MLSLILPTYNEAGSLEELLPILREELKDLEYEIIVVDDDSPDGTWRMVQVMGGEWPQLKVLRRIGRRGLSSAVIEGFIEAKGDVFIVMDADGQHDHTLIAGLYEAVNSGADVAIGSRYIPGGSVGEWDERRHLMSKIATSLALLLCRTKVRDPMSGFFAISKNVFKEVHESLNPKGFKILLDILVHVPKGTPVKELPFTFRTRIHGESKLSPKVQLEFLSYLFDETIGRFIPRFFVRNWFLMILTVTTIFLIPRAWSLRMMISKDTRAQILTAVEIVALDEGWLLSNISLRNITKEHIRIVHRSHRRGEDSKECLIISLPDFQRSSCEES